MAELNAAQLEETINRFIDGDGFGVRGEQAKASIPDQQIASQFIKRLANDWIAKGDAQSMQQLVEQLLEKAEAKLVENAGENGTPPTPAEIADRAAADLANALRAKGGLGQMTPGPEREAWEQVEAGLEKIFVEGGSAADIANKLREGMVATPTTSEPNKETHLWTLFNNSGADFSNIALTEDQLQALKFALNQMIPGMGDVVDMMFDNKFGIAREEPLNQDVNAQRQAEISFEGAFDAMSGNAGLAAFHGVAPSNGVHTSADPNNPSRFDNTPVYPRPWNSRENLDGFFRRNDEMDPNETYSFYAKPPPLGSPSPWKYSAGAEHPDGTEPMLANFETMILKPLEDKGAIEFKDTLDEDGNVIKTADEARAEFIEYNEQLMTGGALNMNFVGNLERAELMRFDSAADKEAFMNEVRVNLDPRMMSDDALAEAVIEIAERHPGAHFIADDPDFDNSVYNPNVKQRIMEATQHVKPPADAKEYAAAVEDYIANHKGIESAAVLDQAGTPRTSNAMAGAVRGMSSAGADIAKELGKHNLTTPKIEYESVDAQNAVLDAFDTLNVDAMRVAALAELGVDGVSGVDLSDIPAEKFEEWGIRRDQLDSAMQTQYDAAVENIVSGISGASLHDPAAIADANLNAAQGGLAEMHDNYKYGQPITITQGNFAKIGFSGDEVPMYGFAEGSGVMNMQEAHGVQGIPDGAAVVIHPQQIAGVLGAEEFEARVVYDGDDRIGYFVSNDKGQGFMLDKDAIDPDVMKEHMPEEDYKKLYESDAMPPTANINAAPEAANRNSPPLQDRSNPDAEAQIALGPQ